jgi:hypothetical protein
VVRGRDPGDVLTTEHGSTVKVNWSKARKSWEHARLVSLTAEAIIAKARDADGTLNVPPAVLIGQLLDYAHVDYWKIKALKDIGVDPDDYCEAGNANMNLQAVR